MGMLSNRGGQGAGYATGTSSFPVTGFPSSAYTGNNSRYSSGGPQGQPSPMAGAIGSTLQLDNRQVIIIMAVLIIVGYGAWHLDNK